jgi:hypothetical protein
MDSSYGQLLGVNKKSTSHYNSNGAQRRSPNKISILYFQISLTSTVTELLPSVDRMVG